MPKSPDQQPGNSAFHVDTHRPRVDRGQQRSRGSEPQLMDEIIASKDPTRATGRPVRGPGQPRKGPRQGRGQAMAGEPFATQEGEEELSTTRSDAEEE
jgi:hypothetical protein